MCTHQQATAHARQCGTLLPGRVALPLAQCAGRRTAIPIHHPGTLRQVYPAGHMLLAHQVMHLQALGMAYVVAQAR